VRGVNNYQHLLSFSGIRHEDVKGVLELGSRDCLDAMWMARHYGVTVTAFECNPEALVRCRNGLAHWANEPPIHLIPLAVWSRTGPLTFYPVTNGNLGASSAFKANPDYPYERYVQSEVTVDAVRLDEFFDGMEFPNVVCMDLQGSEMEALKGMGERLHEVDVLVSEVQNRRLYHDTPLHEDLTAYLAEFGLVPVKTVAANKWFGDCLYMRQS
jgi:FkbM family methyltransferase